MNTNLPSANNPWVFAGEYTHTNPVTGQTKSKLVLSSREFNHSGNTSSIDAAIKHANNACNAYDEMVSTLEALEEASGLNEAWMMIIRKSLRIAKGLK